MKKNIFDIELSVKGNLFRLILGAVVFAGGMALDRIIHAGFIPLAVLLGAYVILGGDIVLRAVKNLFNGRIFDENFLMSLATIGAFIIGEEGEAAGVMLFYQIGEFFQERAVNKSKKSISDLMDIRPDYANLSGNGGITRVPPDTVNIGDLIIVKPGEKIPLDGTVTEGTSMIDTSALTGESVPRKAAVSDTVLSGCVNVSGKLTVKVIKTFGESTVSKIIDLVENSANRKANTENFITRFARVYTPVVVILSVLLAAVPPLFFAGEWKVWIHRALVFLVISCPCALVLSIPMGFFAGIGRAAKNGILVKGGNYLEAFNQLRTVVFDKTGTLTKGVFKVTEIISAPAFSDDEVLKLAALAEAYSNHPAALSIMKACAAEAAGAAKTAGADRQLAAEDHGKITDYTEIAGCGVSVCFNNEIILAGNRKLMEKNGIAFEEPDNFGTRVYIAKGGVYAGCVVISDELKNDSKNAVALLKERGVRRTVMLTGDTPEIAQKTAAELGLDEVYAGLLPHEKVEKLETIKKQDCTEGKLAFAGDGINDAPSLAVADIGIAMGALGSDAAIEAADVVLMTDEVSKLSQAMDIAKFTGIIIRQNIIFILCVKILFLTLGAFGIASMWEAVFADVGVSLLAVLNSMRITNAHAMPFQKQGDA